MTHEDDPKEAAKKERKSPATEKILRQFLTLESGNFVTKKMRDNYDVAIKGSPTLDFTAHCTKCEYTAETIA